MKTKTIIIISIIILAIYFGYKMRKENLENELDCKWTDNKGTVYNPNKSDCFKCNKCENNISKEITLRTSCIEGGSNKENNLGFIKYHKSSACKSY